MNRPIDGVFMIGSTFLTYDGGKISLKNGDPSSYAIIIGADGNGILKNLEIDTLTDNPGEYRVRVGIAISGNAAIYNSIIKGTEAVRMENGSFRGANLQLEGIISGYGGNYKCFNCFNAIFDAIP